MSVDQFDTLSVVIDFILWSLYTDTVDPSKVQLHWSIHVLAFKPSCEEPTVDLLQFDNEHTLDVLMDDKLSQSMLLRPMSITQANLLKVVLIQTNCRTVEVPHEVLKAHPEDAIKFLIDAKLLTQMLLIGLRFLLPIELPFTLRAGSVRVPDLDQPDCVIKVIIDHCECRQHSVRVMVCQSFSLDTSLLIKLQ